MMLISVYSVRLYALQALVLMAGRVLDVEEGLDQAFVKLVVKS